ARCLCGHGPGGVFDRLQCFGELFLRKCRTVCHPELSILPQELNPCPAEGSYCRSFSIRCGRTIDITMPEAWANRYRDLTMDSSWHSIATISGKLSWL